MKDLFSPEINRYRLTGPEIQRHFGGVGDEGCGAFEVPSPTDSTPIFIIASNGEGWDHVSASTRSRCPTWSEMDHIKRLFFEDKETAMQLHVPPAEHINRHNFTLHLWRPHGQAIPKPPAWMVG